MPTCPFCAEDIKGTETLCPHCGSRLKEDEKPAPKPPPSTPKKTPPTPGAAGAPTKAKSGAGKAIVIVIVVLIVIGGGAVAAWLLLFGGITEEQAVAADEQEPNSVTETKPAPTEAPTPASKQEPTPEPVAVPTPEPEKPTAPPPLVMVSVSGVPDFSTNEASESQKDLVKEHNNKGMKAYEARDYTLAIAEFTKALQANPAAILPRYNLACSFALNGETEKAIDLLQQFKVADCEKCRERIEKAKTDKDFTSIRSNERFKRIVGE